MYRNEKKLIDYRQLAQENVEDAMKIFAAYDVQGNGYIVYEEIGNLLIDLGFKEKYGENFQRFLQEQFEYYDTNGDGVISYEEFIHIHNNLLEH